MKTSSCTEKKHYAFDNAPRCGARTKRYNGRPCRSPAVRGKKRCRIHGGGKGSGAKQNNKNALKHGQSTLKITAIRRSIKHVFKQWDIFHESHPYD